jgi:23S rRNA (adenine2503-C2)-methyltransferase
MGARQTAGKRTGGTDSLETANPGAPVPAAGLTLPELTGRFKSRYGKGGYHAEAVFRQISGEGRVRPSLLPEFSGSGGLARRIENDYSLDLPRPVRRLKEGLSEKYVLSMKDGLTAETVFIPMSGHNTVCVSSQIGCRFGCLFCTTARMGFIRHLTAEEILLQVLFVLHREKKEIRNIVFMGMGEPLDNTENLFRALDIITDPRGLNIPSRFISVSTAGHAVGLRKLKKHIRDRPDRHYHCLTAAFSLNFPDNTLRDRYMPLNRRFPLEQVRNALSELPQSSRKDGLYIEYVLLPGINDGREHTDAVCRFLDGMTAKINLIPYNPGTQPLCRTPAEEELLRFRDRIRERGFECRTRKSKGEGIMAACGQLGSL